jgi:hypothetical protein
MRTFGIIMLCILAVIGSGLAWCNFAYPTYTYRYRMTVEVNVDGVVHSGSSVVEIKLQTQPNLLSNPPIVPHVHGQAVFIDLGGGRNVFAMLASGPDGTNLDYPYQIIPRVFKDTFEFPYFAKLHGRREIPDQFMPTLVTFGDLNDAATARVVNSNEFGTVFGPDVRLNGAWIEVTEEPVTSGIENRLPWWNGPFPWLKPMGGGAYIDTRRNGFRWQKEMFNQNR